MKINDRNYDLKFTGKTLLIYKEEFHEDLLKKLSDKNFITEPTNIYGLLWALVKTCDNSFPSFDEWFGSLSMPEIANILNKQTIEEMTKTLSFDNGTTKDLKKN